jgi:hypothetical protein
MTAGLPSMESGGSTHPRRILAALLIATIAVAPAHAQSAPPAAIESAAPYDIEDAAMTTDTGDAPEVSEPIARALPSEATTPAEHAEAAPAERAPPSSVDQVIYKGLVGNLLEAVPLDPEQRVQLQRGNAIINNAFTGRSLAMLLGIASPPLMIAGLIWGIWSAFNIKPAQTDTRTALAPLEPAIQAQEPADPVTAPHGDGTRLVDGGHVAAQSLD